MNKYQSLASGIHRVRAFPSSLRDELLVRIYGDWINGGIDSSNILIITDSRHHAGWLKETILNEVKNTLGEVRVTTFSALSRTLLEDYFSLLGLRKPPKLLTGPEQRRLIQALFPEKGKSFIQEIFDLFYRWEENGYSFEEIKALAESHDRPKWVEVYPLYETYLERLQAENKLDYGLLLHRGAAILQKVGPKLGFTHLLFSDFQDLNHSQFRIVQGLASHSHSLAAFGDEREAINGFRGSSTHYFSEFKSFFPSSGGWRFDGKTFHMETGKADLHAVDPAVKIYWQDFSHYIQEVQFVADQVARLIHQEGVPFHEIAVFYRSLRKSSLPSLLYLLEEYGIPCKVYGSAENLYQKPRIKELLALLYFVAREAGLELTLRIPPQQLLFSPLFGLTPKELKAISRAFQLEMDGQYIHHLLGLKDFSALQDLGLHGKLEGLQKGLLSSLDALSCGLSAFVRHAWSLCQNIPDLSEDKELWGDIGEFFKECREFEAENEGLSPLEQIAGFIEMALSSHFSEDRAEEDLGEPLNRVSVLPLSRAKGLRYEAVFMLEMSEEILPQQYRTHEMADPLLLTRGSAECGMGNGESEAEITGNSAIRTPNSALLSRQLLFEENERRIFYLGCNSAKNFIFLSSSKITPTQVELKPSRFKLEIVSRLAEGSPPPLTVAPSLKALENGLRKRIGSSVLSLERADFLEKAADHYQLRLISEGAAHRPWRSLSLTSPSESPFAPDKLVLSASRIQTYLDCPLKFKYSLLNLPEESPDVFLYGQIMHKVLEKLHHPVQPLPLERGAVKALLDELFEKAEFQYLAVKVHSQQRMEEAFGKYLDKIYGSPLSVQRVEQPFTFNWRGVKFRGRIDRIDRLEIGGVELIDYKSSSSKITKADAQEDIQLGLYYLAFSQIDELSRLGQVKKLSYWYISTIGPRSDGKVTVIPDESYQERIQLKLDEALEGIFSEKFPAKPGGFNTCSGCNYQELCPRFDSGVV